MKQKTMNKKEQNEIKIQHEFRIEYIQEEQYLEKLKEEQNIIPFEVNDLKDHLEKNKRKLVYEFVRPPNIQQIVAKHENPKKAQNFKSTIKKPKKILKIEPLNEKDMERIKKNQKKNEKIYKKVRQILKTPTKTLRKESIFENLSKISENSSSDIESENSFLGISDIKESLTTENSQQLKKLPKFLNEVSKNEIFNAGFRSDENFLDENEIFHSFSECFIERKSDFEKELITTPHKSPSGISEMATYGTISNFFVFTPTTKPLVSPIMLKKLKKNGNSNENDFAVTINAKINYINQVLKDESIVKGLMVLPKFHDFLQNISKE